LSWIEKSVSLDDCTEDVIVDPIPLSLFVPDPEKTCQPIQKDDGEEEDNPDIDRILYDIKFHEDPSLQSKDFINIFQEDGTLIQRHFCIKCLKSFLKYSLKKMYDKNNDCIEITEVQRNSDSFIDLLIDLLDCKKREGTQQYCPIIALGQMLWAFIKEPLLANSVRTWLTASALFNFYHIS